ncbi:Electron transfer flavoprotein (Etf), beta-subunit [Desulfatibacillum aliphaticivorans]|uniref:Electron transfer flavoprotein subunit beta n=1 Tax=Desulfatibacillum aliphaticivorans TaxID=218208 RepID=B8FCM3_DESAL|nr:electron transfer flavoprotein subunit beta/FixA family protein [Desulfatibacillum aliphaticivorans]ACL06186.1 Electron transfer flavoprotein (Etf), beta-subunit [Desulfatibacillum aliphaticivorans]
MKILVCVKQVPDPEVDLELTPDGRVTPKRDSYVMNRLDEYAMEEAMRLKESMDGVQVEAVTVGPEEAEASLRRALAMGASNGIFIPVDEDRALTSFETASLIASAVKDKNYDLIMCGVMSEDEMAGAVGPMIAGILDLPWVTSAISLEKPADKNAVDVLREGEGGVQETIQLTLPALATIQSGTRQPRYPSLSNMMRANKQELEVVGPSGQSPSRPVDQILGAAPPKQKGQGVFLEGSTAEKARQLVSILKERALL